MPDCNILIVGGGLAGLSLAHAFTTQGVRDVVLLEAGSPGDGASGAPQTMMHPLPGLSLAPKLDYLEAFDWTQQWLYSFLHKSPSQSLHSWLWKTSLLRPLWPDDSASERLLRSFTKHSDSYKGVLHGELLSESESRLWHPHPVIRLTPAYAIKLPKFLKVISAQLQDDIDMVTHTRVTEIRHNKKQWCVHTSSTSSDEDAPQTWRARTLIYAVGSGLCRWFPTLPLVLTGGELLSCSPPDISLDAMVSYRGHLVPWPEQNWTLGATYWDVPSDSAEDWFSWSSSTGESNTNVDGFLSRMSGFFPWLKTAHIESVWRGCRTVVHPDRQPLVGPVPAQKNAYVLGALASKGLLLGPWLAHRLVDHILHETKLPAWADTRRIKKELY